MDLIGCSAKGSQKVARENITQNTFFFSWGGGQDGTKKQQLLEICPFVHENCNVYLSCIHVFGRGQFLLKT